MSSMRMNLVMEELREMIICVSGWSMEDWETRADSDSYPLRLHVCVCVCGGGGGGGLSPTSSNEHVE